MKREWSVFFLLQLCAVIAFASLFSNIYPSLSGIKVQGDLMLFFERFSRSSQRAISEK